jgi:acetyl-CoA carboxylase carboxyltransferase component
VTAGAAGAAPGPYGPEPGADGTPLRIGNASGFYGDRAAALREMLEGGPLHVLTGDYLAELTMLILGRDRLKDPGLGYAKTFLRQLEEGLGLAHERGVRIVANAGGLNPAGLAAAVRELAAKTGVPVSVAHVEGDDLLGRRALLPSGDALTANAYLGGGGITACLRAGADVVVTGRVTDAALVSGPAAWWFGWEPGEYDALAGAVAAGHVLECGTQATGGNYAFFGRHDVRRPGFPLAEISADGSAVVTKHPGTGGAVTVGTVTAQLLYETQGARYAGPDVTARLDTVRLAQVGPDRVRLSGTRGEAPPDTLKVGTTRIGGWRNETVFVLTGLDVEEKAALVRAAAGGPGPVRGAGGPGAVLGRGGAGPRQLPRLPRDRPARTRPAVRGVHRRVRAGGRGAAHRGPRLGRAPRGAGSGGGASGVGVGGGTGRGCRTARERRTDRRRRTTREGRTRRCPRAAAPARRGPGPAPRGAPRGDPAGAARDAARGPQRGQGRGRQPRRVGRERARLGVAGLRPHHRRPAGAAPRDRPPGDRPAPPPRPARPQLRDPRPARRGRGRPAPVRPAGQGPRRVVPLPVRRDPRPPTASGGEPVTRLGTRIDPRDPEYAAHRATALERLAALAAEHAKALAGGGPKYTERHRGRGKLLARERIELLLDPDTPFLELSPLAAWGSDYPVGASMVTGIGTVEGTSCLITANDPTVRGGASNPWTLRKALRANEIARANRLPCISLVESGGADLPSQKEIFIPGGAIFRDLTRLSAAGIPTLAVVFGNSTAGGAYVPGMSDHVIMVKERAKVFLGGPPLVKMATGEESDDESLGGADMHARTSGLADQLALDEQDALRQARRVVARLNHRRAHPEPGPAEEPLYDPEELLGIVPGDLKTPFDPREVIARIVDGSDFDEFKPLYGSGLATGWASLHGYPVGILANSQGVLFSEESQKAAQFIQLANQRDVPLLFLHNTTGYMVGREYEQGGIVKHGSMMINAVSNSKVPHLSVLIGASYGAGHYGMCGRAYDPRFLFAWPSAKSAVMGPQQLAGVLSIVARQSAAAKGLPYDEEADAGLRALVEQQIESESLPVFLSGRLYDDGIIDPRDTRTVLGLCLSAVHNAPVEGARGGFGVFRM